MKRKLRESIGKNSFPANEPDIGGTTYGVVLPTLIRAVKVFSHPIPGVVLLLLLGCVPMNAFTKVGDNVLLTNGSARDTQKAINAATNGTIIELPSGEFTWWRQVTNFNNTAIHLVAKKIGGTIIKRGYKQESMLAINASPNGNVEVSGIHFVDPYADQTVNWTYCLDIHQLSGLPVLVHDCSFVNTSTNGFNYTLRFVGNGGVVWNCSFASKGDELSGIIFVNTSSTYAPWNQPDSMGASPDSTGLNPGDPSGTGDTYVENCLFQDMDVFCTDFDDNSRAVIRDCTLNNASLGSHGQDTSVWGCRHWEVYDNTFHYSGGGRSYGGQRYPLNMNSWFNIHGGTGVIANNSMDDIPDKFGIVMTVYTITRQTAIKCQTAYPAARQTGQGWSAASTANYGNPMVSKDGTGAIPDPIYIWGTTGSEAKDPDFVGAWPFTPDECGNNEKIGTFLQEGRDYFVNEARPGWTRYTYPHPLRANALGATGSGPLELYPK